MLTKQIQVSRDHLDSDSHWSEWFPSALHFLVNQKAGLRKALLQFLRDRHPHLSPGCFKPAASSCGQMTGVPFSSQPTLRKQIWRAEWKSRQHTLQTYLKVYSWVFEIKPEYFVVKISATLEKHSLLFQRRKKLFKIISKCFFSTQSLLEKYFDELSVSESVACGLHFL